MYLSYITWSAWNALIIIHSTWVFTAVFLIVVRLCLYPLLWRWAQANEDQQYENTKKSMKFSLFIIFISIYISHCYVCTCKVPKIVQHSTYVVSTGDFLLLDSKPNIILPPHKFFYIWIRLLIILRFLRTSFSFSLFLFLRTPFFFAIYVNVCNKS